MKSLTELVFTSLYGKKARPKNAVNHFPILEFAESFYSLGSPSF